MRRVVFSLDYTTNGSSSIIRQAANIARQSIHASNAAGRVGVGNGSCQATRGAVMPCSKSGFICITACALVYAHFAQRYERRLPRASDWVMHELKEDYERIHIFAIKFSYAEPILFDSFESPRIRRTALAFGSESSMGGAGQIYTIDGSRSMWQGDQGVGAITCEGDMLYRISDGPRHGSKAGTVMKMVQGKPVEFTLCCCADRNMLCRIPGGPFNHS